MILSLFRCGIFIVYAPSLFVERAFIPKRLAIALLFSAIFLLSGCVRVESFEQFYPNGRSRVLSQIYIENLANNLELSGLKPPANYTGNASWKNYLIGECNNFSSRQPGKYCHESQGWLIIDDARVSGYDYAFASYEAFPFTVYELTIFSPPIPEIGEFSEIGNFRFPKNLSFSGANKTMLSQIRASGLKYNYTIVVPGEILEYNYGEKRQDGIIVDALAAAEADTPIRIKSRELNLSQVAIVAIGLILVFLFIDFVLIWALKAWAKRSDDAEQRRRRREAEDARRRIFRKDARLKENEVYIAPDDSKKLPPI